jgi:uncharacterized membrane protein
LVWGAVTAWRGTHRFLVLAPLAAALAVVAMNQLYGYWITTIDFFSLLLLLLVLVLLLVPSSRRFFAWRKRRGVDSFLPK